MTPKQLPVAADDMQIKELVVEWSEHLAHKRYAEALGMIPSANAEMEWTPVLLEKVILGYGVLDIDSDSLQGLLNHWEVSEFEVTTLIGREDRDEIIREKIDVDRENHFGLDQSKYLGMVHYDDVPLCGYRSDLTARFCIKKLGDDFLSLEFLDLHVM
ncbi:MAG: hypothetical protein ACR2IE_00450 [Candidatus Sumerlaeaceae bacterium]